MYFVNFSQLSLLNPVTLTGESFTLQYHYNADIWDFLVLRQNYDLAIQRNWLPGQRFRSISSNKWWEGNLENRTPICAKYLNSLFLCCLIR